MTRYTVVWDLELDRAFTDAWVSGDSQMRATLTAISNWLDVALAQDPDRQGHPRPGDAARTIEVPLSVSSVRAEATYRVFAEDRLVRVDRLDIHID